MKKNNWLILGVALSVLWAVAAGLHQHDADVAAAKTFANFAYKACIGSPENSGPAGARTCDQARQDNLATWMKNSGANVAVAALAPIPVGWLAGYILLTLWRIQVIGFRGVFPWSSLTRARKLAVFGCGAAVAAASFMLALTMLNLYADARVPVGLSSSMTVFSVGDDTVYAQGTWTRHGDSPGSEMGYPLQTSTIICNRPARRCREARATVAEAETDGGASTLLSPELFEFEVSSWDNGVITYRDEGLCTSESYTIDTNTESVTGLGRAINEENQWCKSHPATEREWTYRMEDGFKVYWPLRQARRPALLKIIQSFFGN
jgi:hypothetical protein